jgi:hypothetical protein
MTGVKFIKKRWKKRIFNEPAMIINQLPVPINQPAFSLWLFQSTPFVAALSVVMDRQIQYIYCQLPNQQ